VCSAQIMHGSIAFSQFAACTPFLNHCTLPLSYACMHTYQGTLALMMSSYRNHSILRRDAGWSLRDFRFVDNMALRGFTRKVGRLPAGHRQLPERSLGRSLYRHESTHYTSIRAG